MKKAILLLLLVGSLCCQSLADEALRLSQEEARQLHALLLVGELQDFGTRAKNASAILMAAELLLDYPTQRQSKERIAKLCQQARSLDQNDELVQAWAGRLETRLRKSLRGPESEFLERTGSLAATQSVVFTGPFRGAWLYGRGVGLTMVNALGDEVDTAAKAEQIRLTNQTHKPAHYQLLLLK